MIVVEVRLRSARGRQYDKLLGGATIANDGSGTATEGNYVYALSKVNARGVLKSGRVTGFQRKRKLAWDLLLQVLKDARDS